MRTRSGKYISLKLSYKFLFFFVTEVIDDPIASLHVLICHLCGDTSGALRKESDGLGIHANPSALALGISSDVQHVRRTTHSASGTV